MRRYAWNGATSALAALATESEFAFSVGNGSGSEPMDATTLTRHAAKYAKANDGFALKRVRSGVETLLALSGVSEEIRWRFQSHGVSGV